MLMYWEQIKTLWKELSLMQKGIAILLLSLTLVFTITMIVWSLRPDYQMLYSGLEYKDIGKVTESLQEKKIKYKIGEDGRSILVPSRDMNRAKVDMAQSEVFKDDLKGYELFDDNKFGVTRFEQQVNLSRAKEAELTRTIRNMELVEDVRVHLVMPQRRTLGVRSTQPKASIILTLFQPLEHSKIDAIRYLVSGSIQGMSPNDVNIIDSRTGDLLAGEQSEEDIVQDRQLTLQQKVEDHLQRKAQIMLDKAVGLENSEVRITAELDFDKIKTTRVEYDADGAALLSEETNKETTEDGANANASLTNFEIPVTVDSIVGSSGNITNIKVSVLVNYDYVTKLNDSGINERVYTPRPQNEIAKLGNMVKKAVGYDINRGDQFEITSIPFDDTSDQNLQKTLLEIQKREFIRRIGTYSLWGLLGVAIFLYIRKFSKKIAEMLYKPPAPPPPEPIPEPEPEIIEFPEEEFDPTAAMIEDHNYQLKKKIADFTNDSPQPAAELLRSWLLEGE